VPQGSLKYKRQKIKCFGIQILGGRFFILCKNAEFQKHLFDPLWINSFLGTLEPQGDWIKKFPWPKIAENLILGRVY
jgi:hypothetical protein